VLLGEPTAPAASLARLETKFSGTEQSPVHFRAARKRHSGRRSLVEWSYRSREYQRWSHFDVHIRLRL